MNNQSDFYFGAYFVEPRQNRVSLGDEVQHLEPRAMDVLVYLVQHNSQIVSADELLVSLWPGRVLQESTIHARINQLRKAFGDSPRESNYIRTVVKRGYQAIAKVSHTNSQPVALHTKAIELFSRSSIFAVISLFMIVTGAIALFNLSERSAQISLVSTETQSPAYISDVNDKLFEVRALLEEQSSSSLTLALQELRHLQTIFPKNPEVHANLANALWLSSRINQSWQSVRDEFNRSLDRALELDAEQPTALLLRARTFASLPTRIEAAEEYYQRAINAAPNNANALKHYGSFLATSQRQYELGYYFLRQALEIEPYSDETWGLLANAYLSAGELDSSYGILLEGLERVPESSALLLRQVHYFLYRGARVTAVEHLLAYIQRDPQALASMNLLVDILSRMQMHDAAASWLDEMKRINSGHSAVYNAEYNHLWYKGDWHSLAKLNDQWDSESTQFSSVAKRNAKIWLLHAQADEFRRSNNIDRAQQLYSEIVNKLLVQLELPQKINGAGGEVIELLWLGNLLGHSLLELERDEEAQQLLLLITSNSGSGPDVAINKSLAFSMLGEQQAAIEAYHEAVSGPPGGEFGIYYAMSSATDWLSALKEDPTVSRLYSEFLEDQHARETRVRVELPGILGPI